MELPAVGTVFADRYRIERALGQGAMSQVFEALDLVLQRKVAVKLIRFDRRSEGHKQEQDLERRFRREALAAARLHSPHIVTIHDLGIADGGTAYIVQDLVQGTDLNLLIHREGRLNPRRVVAL